MHDFGRAAVRMLRTARETYDQHLRRSLCWPSRRWMLTLQAGRQVMWEVGDRQSARL